MVNIDCGGNIRAQRCQETHYAKVKLMHFRFSSSVAPRCLRSVWFKMGFCVSLVFLASQALQAADSFAGSEPATRARVLFVEDAEATDAFRPRPERIKAMVNRGITNLTGKADVPEAWRSLVSTQD